jgi:DNA mismatch repair protein MutS|tara:strand:+ start:633 stop:3248 length:2616 start_codon:yes stop_codon:yes gene_type:complete
MIAQFLKIKSEYPDALLFYRMGDFYELFFDDAIAAARALDISLTKRGKHLGEDIPMCGVPHHASENYLLTLIRKGFRVAVCEQLESPAEAKARGSKSVVNRGVVRLVTSGTLTEESLLSARENNYLSAFAILRDESAFAWVDVSTGDFHVQNCPRISFGPMLAQLNPAEILISESNYENFLEQTKEFGSTLTSLSPASFDSTSGIKRLCDLFKVNSIDGFGSFSRSEISALGAIIDYLEITQKGKLPALKIPIKENLENFVQIDSSTRRNLELTQTLSGSKNGSLLRVIDRTVTGPGARLLEKRLSSPSTCIKTITPRLDSIDVFKSNNMLRMEIQNTLKQTADMERAFLRISLDRGGPRDFLAIRDSLEKGQDLSKSLINLNSNLIEEAEKNLNGNEKIIALLKDVFSDSAPLLARDGGFIRSGFNVQLDDIKKLRDDGRQIISSMQAQFSSMTGIGSLKIKYNNVLGYFIETPATHAKKMLGEEFSNTFIHRQTTANAVRFTTLELSEIETKILNAGGRALSLELEIFEQTKIKTLEFSENILLAAKALAEIDLAVALADIAVSENWCRPKLDTSRKFKIIEGRHPVVEAALQKEPSGVFIANNCDLSAGSDGDKPIWLLTGPNMAGKSTFLRQNAIIALMAQIGSFVPAESAEIGIIDQLFSRVGASDDLARGRSTFMVEMVETAAILNQAGENALVILDEIGRGTATYDGLSIAWATLENLHNINKCRALFATHYHELTGLTVSLPGLMNATVSVREWEGDIIFLHEVRKGAADRSYGVQVAKLAGIPQTVINRATEVLEKLENNDQGGKTQTLIDELPLFNISPSNLVKPDTTSSVEMELKSIHPDELTPKDALSLIYKLKAFLKD